jgi:small-conductance mechanosensitive channel
MGDTWLVLRRQLIDPSTWPGALALAVVFALFALFACRISRTVIRNGSRHLSDPTAAAFVTQLAQVAIVLGAIILYAHLVPPLRSLGGALLTGASVSAVVVGLAAQSTLGNLIAGFSLLLYHPFRLDDQVEINTPRGVMRGRIQALNLGYTTLLTADNDQIVVPNGAMASGVMIRISNHASPATQPADSAIKQ